MKKIISTLIFPFLFIGCSDNDSENKYPECIQNQIETFLKNYPTSPNSGTKASVKKYLYKGETVYLTDFTPGFPDGATGVTNEKCEAICQLGGIDGSASDCIDWDKAEFLETVWIDAR